MHMLVTHQGTGIEALRVNHSHTQCFNSLTSRSHSNSIPYHSYFNSSKYKNLPQSV